jgi:uroporphyrinogen decarboxylase
MPDLTAARRCGIIRRASLNPVLEATMPKETMSPRERWLAVLRRQTPDRVPMDYWGTAEATLKIRKHLGVATTEEMFDRLHIDTQVAVEPKYVGPPVPPGTDVYGIRTRTVEHEGGAYGEVANNPLAQFNSVAEIEKNYRWPSNDWYDFSGIPGQIKGKEHRPIGGFGSEPFLLYKSLRGQEQAFVDLVENPEIVHYCLDKLFGLAYEGARRILETIPGKVLTIYVAEDMGSQEDLMMSVAHIREFLLPGMKRMADLAHSAGAYVFHHNDGACWRILPEMISVVGINILNPIQWKCKGMERERLKRDFGDRLIFHGGVDNQHTLPFGTVAEVRQEVIDDLRILGAGGGYILAPCHNIQVVGPAENVVAMYETGYEYGWRG